MFVRAMLVKKSSEITVKQKSLSFSENVDLDLTLWVDHAPESEVFSVHKVSSESEQLVDSANLRRLM